MNVLVELRQIVVGDVERNRLRNKFLGGKSEGARVGSRGIIVNDRSITNVARSCWSGVIRTGLQREINVVTVVARIIKRVVIETIEHRLGGEIRARPVDINSHRGSMPIGGLDVAWNAVIGLREVEDGVGGHQTVNDVG